MPHRPEGTTNNAAAAAAAASYNSLATIRGETAAHIMRPNGMYGGMVTNIMGNKSWLAAHAGMVPLLDTPKSADSADRSTISRHDEDTVATLATESTAEELEKREHAAALLMVSGMRSGAQETQEQIKQTTSESASSMPLKKRMKGMNYVRNNEVHPTDNKNSDPCHVSPVSHSSVGSPKPPVASAVSTDEITPQGAAAQRCNSYDSKETPYKKESAQPLLDASKISDSKDIGPPSTVVMPHFPTVLHQVLSDPSCSSTVLQWLPDGEAWKVLRWDALRRQVLPKYFSDLTDENGNGTGTIDAFLWHLTAWGFEEIKEGSAVGAYRHDLFIRGAQKLCTKMQFSVREERRGPKTVSPARVRSLQVPSLNLSSSGSEITSPEGPNKRPRFEGQTSVEIPRRSPLNWPMAFRGNESYGAAAADSAAWNQYYAEHLAMRQMAGKYSSPSPSPNPLLNMAAAEHALRQQAASQYSPPAQVRSGRGAAAGRRGPSPTQSPAGTPSMRPSFPVSNRGKGRNTAGNRGAIPADASSAERKSPVQETALNIAEAHRIGVSVQAVAVAVSRKTKRKLPLSRNTSADNKEVQ